MIDSLTEKFKQLRLNTFAHYIDQTMKTAEEKNWSSMQIIEHLADLELNEREKNCHKKTLVAPTRLGRQARARRQLR